MADEGSEFERPRKIPRTLKEKDSGKRLIVILERASLEAVKVLIEIDLLLSGKKYLTENSFSFSEFLNSAKLIFVFFD